jgi:hypothetical protein
MIISSHAVVSVSRSGGIPRSLGSRGLQFGEFLPLPLYRGFFLLRLYASLSFGKIFGDISRH